MPVSIVSEITHNNSMYRHTQYFSNVLCCWRPNVPSPDGVHLFDTNAVLECNSRDCRNVPSLPLPFVNCSNLQVRQMIHRDSFSCFSVLGVRKGGLLNPLRAKPAGDDGDFAELAFDR